MFKTKTIAFLTAAVFAVGAGSASAAAPDAPWAAAGTGSTVATSNGTSTDPVLDYSATGFSGAWTFSATAKTTRQQSVDWRYKGYHAWYRVTVRIEKFVVRGGQQIVTETLSAAGPVNCCAAPSGGFEYSGKTTFDLRAGDVYGFRMSGSHSDADRRLLGKLTLAFPPAALTGEFQVLTDRINARNAQIKQLQADLRAANAAGNTAKAQELSLQLQTLMAQNNNDLQVLSNLLHKAGMTNEQILKNINP